MEIFESPEAVLQIKSEEISAKITNFIETTYPVGKSFNPLEARMVVTYESFKILGEYLPIRFIPDIEVDIDNKGAFKISYIPIAQQALKPEALN